MADTKWMEPSRMRILQEIEAWSPEVLIDVGSGKYRSRQFDIFGDCPNGDVEYFERCRDVVHAAASGIAGRYFDPIAIVLVVPLRPRAALPSPEVLSDGVEFLIENMDRNDLPSVYILPKGQVGEWPSDWENYRFPIDKASLGPDGVDALYFRYHRMPIEIVQGDEYSGALYACVFAPNGG